jgi:hypothetical protein
MLKEITHEKAIETLKSGGEIVVKRDNNQLDVRYKIDNNNLMWTIEDNKWNGMATRTLADFLAEPVYIEAEPLYLNLAVIVEPDDSLGEIITDLCMFNRFVGDCNYKVEVSKETYKPIDMGQVISNYHLGNRLYASEHHDLDVIFAFHIDDNFPVSSLKKYNWYESKKSTSIHELKISEFFDFYPGKFYTGPCTITIKEIE